MSNSGPTINEIKASMRAQWMAGDFGVVAKTIGNAAEDFVQRLALPPGTRVLDVACGTGNTAVPLARSGCIVTGVDIATNLLEQARKRAATEGVRVEFVEGDAEALPFADASFDALVTMFGAMFAPRPELVVQEAARVLKPGGLLAMANWTPQGFSGLMFRTNARHVPPPPGLQPPVFWGDPEKVQERLGLAFQEVETTVIPTDFDLPTNPAGVVTFFRQYFGPTKMAFSRLDEQAQQALRSDLEQLWSEHNVAENPKEHTLIRNEYLHVSARRR